MPDRQALYLFVAARRPYRRKDSPQRLAAKRGSAAGVAYNRMSGAAEYVDAGAISRGTLVYFGFTERAHALFVPVRQCEVVAVQRPELMLRPRVLLRSRVSVEDDPVDFARPVRKTHPGLAPGDESVIPKRDDPLLQPCFDQRRGAGAGAGGGGRGSGAGVKHVWSDAVPLTATLRAPANRLGCWSQMGIRFERSGTAVPMRRC